MRSRDKVFHIDIMSSWSVKKHAFLWSLVHCSYWLWIGNHLTYARVSRQDQDENEDLRQLSDEHLQKHLQERILLMEKETIAKLKSSGMGIMKQGEEVLVTEQKSNTSPTSPKKKRRRLLRREPELDLEDSDSKSSKREVMFDGTLSSGSVDEKSFLIRNFIHF